MQGPTFSPDGKWMWDGNEWIPAPPPSNNQNLQHEQRSELGADSHNTATSDNLNPITNNSQNAENKREQIKQENIIALARPAMIANPIVTIIFLISIIFSDWFWNSDIGTLCCITGWIIGMASLSYVDSDFPIIGYMGLVNTFLGIIAGIDAIVGFGNFIRYSIIFILIAVVVSLGGLTSGSANSNMVSVNNNNNNISAPTSRQVEKIKTYSCNCGHAFIADTGTPSWQTSKCPNCGNTCWPIK